MKINTNHPIAINSPDHLYPWGTKADNSTDARFIEEVELYFNNKKISFLDIGCSGGQLVVDFHNRGHLSIGIEGSNYSVIHQRANWPAYHNNILFTCDATHPYTILDDTDNKILFDCITAWEVVEHIAPNELDMFFTNILNHMHDTSIFIGSISLVNDFHDGNGTFGKKVELHQSVFTEKTWMEEILPRYFNIEKYPFSAKVRPEPTSFFVKLLKK